MKTLLTLSLVAFAGLVACGEAEDPAQESAALTATGTIASTPPLQSPTSVLRPPVVTGEPLVPPSCGPDQPMSYGTTVHKNGDCCSADAKGNCTAYQDCRMLKVTCIHTDAQGATSTYDAFGPAECSECPSVGGKNLDDPAQTQPSH